MKYCTRCGSRISDEFKFCSDCGNDLYKTKQLIESLGQNVDKNIESNLILTNNKPNLSNPNKISRNFGNKKIIANSMRVILLILIIILLVNFNRSIIFSEIEGSWKAVGNGLIYDLKMYEEHGHLSIAKQTDNYIERIAVFPVSLIENSGKAYILDISGRKYENQKSTVNSFLMELNGIYTNEGRIYETVEFIRNN